MEDADSTRRYPAEARTRIEVRTWDGRRLTAETTHPTGQRRNPPTDAKVEAKLRGLASPLLGAGGGDRVLTQAWPLDKATCLAPLLEAGQRLDRVAPCLIT